MVQVITKTLLEEYDTAAGMRLELPLWRGNMMGCRWNKVFNVQHGAFSKLERATHRSFLFIMVYKILQAPLCIETEKASVVQWLGFHPSKVEVRVRFTAVAQQQQMVPFCLPLM